ncbi:MAG: YdcF family protein [Phycisphaerae bacterium]|nr:YdcF family protein [Phycisphaerae bacterium]
MPCEIDSPSADNPQPAARAPVRRAPFRMLAWCYCRARALFAVVALLQIILVCTPITDRLYRWLDVTKPPQQADLIVCLGGNEARLLWAVDAYHRGLAPRIVVSNLPGAAQWMRNKLLQCGIPADRVILDDASGTTAEHPPNVARLPGLDPARHRFLLVTDHDHSRRALACFRKAGFTHVSVYGSGFPMRDDGPFHMRCRWRILVLPRLLYEYAALVQYRWQGRI